MSTDIITFDFADVETTGLIPKVHETWEIAIVQRVKRMSLYTNPELVGVWQIRPHYLDRAEPKALEINRFHERFMVPEGSEAAWIVDGAAYPMTRAEAIEDITWRLMKAILIGSNTAFDASFLRELLGQAPWHYRVVNALELAAGVLLGRGESVTLPWDSYSISRRIGVEPPKKGEGHTALVDALWARDVFDQLGVEV
jgi:DNA polymerase III epsilon subunit-like protein